MQNISKIHMAMYGRTDTEAYMVILAKVNGEGRKATGKEPLENPRRRCVDNNKTDVGDRMR
jgi:hypothetical protein